MVVTKTILRLSTDATNAQTMTRERSLKAALYLMNDPKHDSLTIEFSSYFTLLTASKIDLPSPSPAMPIVEIASKDKEYCSQPNAESKH